MAKAEDEFDALRTVVETLEPFDQPKQELILKWARERLGIGGVQPTSPLPSILGAPAAVQQTGASGPVTNIKSFVSSKDPKSDMQFAATVAYYYQFEAPEGLRKDEIGKDDLIEACRQVGRKRPPNPGQTLINAHHQGLLDKGNGKGAYCLNSVGENLVAMALPGGASEARARGKRPGRSANPRQRAKTSKTKGAAKKGRARK